MSSFTEDIQLKISSRRDKFATVIHQYDWYTSPSSKLETIVIEIGFVTDGLSVPWLLSWMFSRYGIFLKAALIHDKNYKEQRYTRAKADQWFREGLLVLGCSKWKANVAYWALRAFGGIAWNRHKK